MEEAGLELSCEWHFGEGGAVPLYGRQEHTTYLMLALEGIPRSPGENPGCPVRSPESPVRATEQKPP